MNETLKTILSRRSIRAYRPDQIKDEELQTILEAGKYAPSGMNHQPWHFTVIQNKEILTKINDICRRIFLSSGNKHWEDRAKAEGFSVFYNAPTLIVVSGNEKAPTYQEDCTLALGTMFLAAESIGVGSCWIRAIQAVFSSEEGQKLGKELGIPEGSKVIGSGAFGYKNVESAAAAPRKEGIVTIHK